MAFFAAVANNGRWETSEIGRISLSNNRPRAQRERKARSMASNPTWFRQRHLIDHFLHEQQQQRTDRYGRHDLKKKSGAISVRKGRGA